MADNFADWIEDAYHICGALLINRTRFQSSRTIFDP